MATEGRPITKDKVYFCTGHPTPTQVEEVYQILMNDDYSEALGSNSIILLKNSIK